jgi:DNA (cytosine-5)-methyltransferase 1
MGYQDNFLRPLVVDLFAGGGGAGTGIELALKRPVDIAVNHDPAAVGMHKANHHYTRHFCESVFAVNPKSVTGGREIGLLWASPDCTHFSRAKGGTPVKKEIRGLAWVVVEWAATVKPRVIMLENVPEFTTWCPLTPDNRPDKSKQYKVTRDVGGRKVKETHGSTFIKFVTALNKLGYAVDWRKLSADDYGAGTTRERLYLIARRDGEPVIFPKPTHGNGKGLLPKHAAAEYIDFSVRGKSVFDRQKPLAAATMKRIARGLDKFTIKNPKPYIVRICHTGDNRAYDVEKPLNTVCGKNEHCIVDGKLTPYIVPTGYGEREGQKPRVNDISEPLGTAVSTLKHNIAAPVLEPFIMCNNNNNVGTAGTEPLHTVTGGNRHFLTEPIVAPFVHSRYGNGDNNRDISEPLPTITAQKLGHQMLINTELLPFIYSRYGKDSEIRGRGVDSPLPTVTSENDHNELTSVELLPFVTVNTTGNIGNAADEPTQAITGVNKHFLLSPHITQYHSEQSERENRAYPADEPINVIDTNPRYALTSAHITKYFGGNYNGAGSAADKPVDTITAIDHNALVASHLCVFRKNVDYKPVTEPLPTITARAEHYAEIKTYFVKYDSMAEVGKWAQVRELLNKYAGYTIADDEILILQIGGNPYYISDIEMRMLLPKELYGCQGFPPDYIFERTADGKPLSKSEQVKKVGNSVCPPVAAALVRANLRGDCVGREIRTMKELEAAVCGV